MYRRKLFFILAVCSIVESCTKTIDFPITGGDNELVLNATLCPDSAISVRLCKSKNVLDSSGIEYINDAEILVYQNNVVFDTLIVKGNGFYSGRIKPEEKRTYTIKVMGSKLESTDSIPQSVKIKSIDTSVVNTGSSRILNCSINFIDQSTTRNYYLLKIYSAPIADCKNLSGQKYKCYDPIINNDVVDTLAGGNIVFFDDSQIDGRAHSMIVSMTYPMNKMVYFHLWSISKSFFDYCYSVASNNQNTTNIFITPSKVKSNVEGGLGIMAAYSISTDSIKVSEH